MGFFSPFSPAKLCDEIDVCVPVLSTLEDFRLVFNMPPMCLNIMLCIHTYFSGSGVVLINIWKVLTAEIFSFAFERWEGLESS